MSESGDVNTKVALEELNSIQESLDKISARIFKTSETSFEVLAQFKLTSESVVEFRMQTTAGERENELLTSFYDAASKLTEYKSIKDEVYVVFHYTISPSVNK
ncbi:hypothetical protein [Thalassomonas sp. RHCl1]|uniref:hypothetical protein n=1 Tax=Thalassomonas sp. RHCl1 TaxID=2995320 RepID=UPI00248C07E2|nr:hypothetical protein [Thalassomonas sp. RHCl1]